MCVCVWGGGTQTIDQATYIRVNGNYWKNANLLMLESISSNISPFFLMSLYHLPSLSKSKYINTYTGKRVDKLTE